MSKENILEVKESEVFKDLIIEIKNEMHEKYVETQNSNISFEDFVEHIEEELSEGISEEELHIFYKVLDQINQNVKKYEVR